MEQKKHRRIVDLFLEADEELIEGEYRVPVSYDLPRSSRELRKDLSVKYSMSGLPFHRRYRDKWQSYLSDQGIDSCEDTNRRPVERIMLVEYLPWCSSTCWSLPVLLESGYRHANHLELYAFAKANPELELPMMGILALGSFIMYDNLRMAAVLNGDCCRHFYTCHLDAYRNGGYKYLLVSTVDARRPPEREKGILVPKIPQRS